MLHKIHLERQIPVRLPLNKHLTSVRKPVLSGIFGPFLVLLAALHLVSPDLNAQQTTTETAEAVNPGEVIAKLSEALTHHYVFPEMTKKILAHLAGRLESGDYDSLTEADALAKELSRDLFEVTDDLHLVVGFDPNWIQEQRDAEEPEAKHKAAEQELKRLEKINFGFEEVRILEGNVGYFNFTYFASPETAHETAASVMKFLENVDALVIDLRNNRGGHLEMAQFLASYLFEAEPGRKLFGYYTIEEGKRVAREEWVFPFIPGGKRLAEQPVFVLTSNATFSAAEWLGFTLKNHGRAKVVGEVTAGAAHPVAVRAIDDQFVVRVPIGEITDSTGADFEGVGVVPDLTVAAPQAYFVAHREALKAIADADPTLRDAVSWHLPVIDARANPVVLTAESIEAVIGQFGERSIYLEGQTLFYSWDGEGRVRMTPLSQDTFAVEGVDFRFRLKTSPDGDLLGIERFDRDGETQLLPKIR